MRAFSSVDFPGVWFARKHRANTVTNQSTRFVGIEQTPDFCGHIPKQRHQLILIGKFHILFDEIQLEFDHRGGINYLLTKIPDVPAQGAFELLLCGLHGLPAFRMNEVGNGLGLG
jgi:hypothetical protein